MTDILDELTEIPFEIFWDKYIDVKPGIYYKSKAEMVWFYMKESDRVSAFECLAKCHPGISLFNEPHEYLQHFNLPF
jgi:hypothetical protein